MDKKRLQELAGVEQLDEAMLQSLKGDAWVDAVKNILDPFFDSHPNEMKKLAKYLKETLLD